MDYPDPMVELDSVERSCLMVVAWRAAESLEEAPRFRDPVAVRVAAALPPWARTPSASLFREIVAYRTAEIDGRAEHALAEGVRQVVTLGAGLDTRFHRVVPPGDTQVWELDREAVNRLASQLIPPRPRTRRVDGPLARARENLEAAGHDPDRPTLWILEGVVEYLPGTSWNRLAETIVSMSAVGSRLVVSALGPALVEEARGDPSFPFLSLPAPEALTLPVTAFAPRVIPTTGSPGRPLPQGASFLILGERAAS